MEGGFSYLETLTKGGFSHLDTDGGRLQLSRH